MTRHGMRWKKTFNPLSKGVRNSLVLALAYAACQYASLGHRRYTAVSADLLDVPSNLSVEAMRVMCLMPCRRGATAGTSGWAGAQRVQKSCRS